jgi:hypothetical protein
MNPLYRVIANNDQDAAACREWWDEATLQDKIRVWECIQRHYDEPEMEIMSRFAQLAFGQMAVEEAAK